MKRCLLYFLMIVFGTSVSAQNLTLQELQNLCKLQNWETGNNILSNKGWEFHDSERGSSYQAAVITYAYNKNYYNNNRASAWFAFYAVNNRVEKIHYTATESAYKSIMSSLASNGYKQIGSDIGYKSLTATYKSQSFLLEITTETQERDDDYGVTHAVHSLELIRLGGAYDDDNGEKTEYYYGTSNVKARYTLKDGKLNGKAFKYNYDGSKDFEATYKNGNKEGKYISYYENGKIQEILTYSDDVLNGQCIEYYDNGNKKSEVVYKNGKINGKCTSYYDDGTIKMTCNVVNDKQEGLRIEYDENGNKTSEVTYKDDKINGKCTSYYDDGTIKMTCSIVNDKQEGLRIEYNENGKKDVEAYFKDGELNGKYIEYDYNDEGELNYQEEGSYLDGEKDGYWETKAKYDDKWQILVFTNYNKGVKHGDAKEWIPGFDTVVYCTYSNGKLNGKYQVKGSLASILGKTYRPWHDKVTFVDGYYADGEKTGHWSYYNKLGWLQEEGDYNDDKMSGEWKYYGMYLPDFNISEKEDTIEESTWVSTPGCLERIENYENGNLNGMVIKYRARSLHRNIIDGKDTIDYIAHYKNGILHGDYEKHDIDRIVLKGQYYDGKRDGEWMEFDSIKWSMSDLFTEINDKPYYVYTETKWIGNYAKDKKNGLWEKYDDKTNQKIMSLTYRNDVLDGTQIYFYNGKEQLVDVFDNGTLKNERVYSDNGELLFEFQYLYDVYDFTGQEIDYVNNTETEYLYKGSYYTVLRDTFLVNFDSLPKVKNGNFVKYDSKHRKSMSGKYSSDKRVGKWKYYLPDQGIYYVINEENAEEPTLFFTDGDMPYTGIAMLKDSQSENITISTKVKKSLIQGIVYIDTKTNKTVKKIKYKNGVEKK